MERKYFCNSSMKFNLDSMITTVQCIKYGFEGDEECYNKYIGNEGQVEIAGTVLKDEYDCYDFLEELYDLYNKSFGKVTGKEYGRIKEIATARQWMRYFTCISNGMSERDAAYAFTD